MYGLVANVMTDHILRTGAKVHVIQYNGFIGRVEVTGLCKSGRRVTKHMAWKRLTNIRPAYIPPSIAEVTRVWWDDKEAAAKVALELTELWRDVRSFHPDGRLLNDGIPQGQAVKEYLAKHKLPSFCAVAPIESVGQRIQVIKTTGHYYAKDAIPKPAAEAS